MSKTLPVKHKNDKVSKRFTDHSERGDFFMRQAAELTLADGKQFQGQAPKGQPIGMTGEVVFNTGMTGYAESLTDPSYSNQILVFTFPLIGNYGVDVQQAESPKIQVSGVIVSTLTTGWSHEGATESLLSWLQSQNIPILFDVDTRALTKHKITLI